MKFGLLMTKLGLGGERGDAGTGARRPPPAATEAVPRAPGSLIGWVGAKPDRRVTGWIMDEAAPDDAVVVRLRAGGWQSPAIEAKAFRQHLKAAGIGSARNGFSLRIPADVPLPEGLEMTLLARGPDGRFLETDIATTACGAQTAEAPPAPASAPDAAGGAAPSAEQAMRLICDGGRVHRKALDGPAALLPHAERLLAKPGLADLLRDMGRAVMREGDHQGALRLLGAAASLKPDDPNAAFCLAIACSRAGRHAEALAGFRRLHPGDWRPAAVASEYAQALRRAMEREGHTFDPDLAATLRSVVEARMAMDDETAGLLPANVCELVGRLGNPELAERALDLTIRARGDEPGPRIAKARMLIAAKRVEEGLAVAAEVLARWPDQEQASHLVRAFRHLGGARPDRRNVARLAVGADGAATMAGLAGGAIASAASGADLRAHLDAHDVDWLLLAAGPAAPSEAALLARIATSPSAGCLRFDPATVLWKATALRDVLEAGLAALPTLREDLDALERFYLRPAPARAPGTALVLSRYGARRFGGAEHFMQSAAMHYRGMGYAPLIVGEAARQDEVADADGTASGGLRHLGIDITPRALRCLVVEHDVALVHAISGTGFATAAALGDMNVPFVYGVHYFREVLGGPSSDLYFDPTGAPVPRPEFARLLARASAVYANSRYTQGLVERVHGVRCPIVFSVPDERAA